MKMKNHHLRFLLLLTTAILSFPLVQGRHNDVSIDSDSECSSSFRALDGTCFGKDLKDKFFLLGENFTNFNHGSFGTVPRPVAMRQYELFLEQESYPDTWFRESYFEYVDRSRRLVASLIGSDSKDVVLVENASSAVNSILRSLGLVKGDVVIRLSTAYGMVIETLSFLEQTVGIQVVVVDVEFPMSGSQQMLSGVKQALTTYPHVKLCVFSHISSMPAVVEPLDALVSAVRDASTSLVLVDGAHTPGHIPLDVPSYRVDFYVGNCHKWIYSSKGTAFLWVSPGQQKALSPEPTVISSSGRHDFVGRFSYTGTRDCTGFAALDAAFSFRDFLGGDLQIYHYCRDLAIQAGRLLTQTWNTTLLVPESMTGYMVNVILPSKNKEAVKYMQKQLNSTFNVYMVAGEIARRGSDDSESIFFTRLSAQVYLELADFVKLAFQVKALLEEGEASSSF